mgnify:CR=1 FL=1
MVILLYAVEIPAIQKYFYSLRIASHFAATNSKDLLPVIKNCQDPIPKPYADSYSVTVSFQS